MVEIQNVESLPTTRNSARGGGSRRAVLPVCEHPPATIEIIAAANAWRTARLVGLYIVRMEYTGARAALAGQSSGSPID
jgi:hypothetical protein